MVSFFFFVQLSRGGRQTSLKVDIFEISKNAANFFPLKNHTSKIENTVSICCLELVSRHALNLKSKKKKTSTLQNVENIRNYGLTTYSPTVVKPHFINFCTSL